MTDPELIIQVTTLICQLQEIWCVIRKRTCQLQEIWCVNRNRTKSQTPILKYNLIMHFQMFLMDLGLLLVFMGGRIEIALKVRIIMFSERIFLRRWWGPLSTRPTRLLGFYSASSLKQQTADRLVVPVRDQYCKALL